MTDQEKQEITTIFTNVLAAHDKTCPYGIDAATATTLKEFADAIREGKKNARKAFITLAIGAICTAIFAGVKELLNK